MNTSTDSNRRLLLLIGAVAAAAAIVVVAVLVSSGGGGSKSPPPKVPIAVRGGQGPFAGIPQTGPTLGNPKAAVTVLEFADLQCPFCRDFTLNTLPKVVSQYVRTGRVKLEFHNYPFLGHDSITAARAAAAAEQKNRLWDFIDAWYRNQGPENSGYATPAFIQKIARVAGLNGPALIAAGKSPATKTILGADASQSQRLGVNSTPTLIVVDKSGRAQEVGDFTQLPAAIAGALGG
jgi:protein-disulfide isomerase